MQILGVDFSSQNRKDANPHSVDGLLRILSETLDSVCASSRSHTAYKLSKAGVKVFDKDANPYSKQMPYLSHHSILGVLDFGQI